MRHLYFVSAAALLLLIPAQSAEKLPEPKRETSPPSDAQRILIKEGVALHDAGDYDGAIAKYKQVLAESPDEVVSLHELSFSYFQKKDYANALATARQGAEFKSALLPQLYVLIGNALDEMGKRVEAIDTYEAAIKRFPDTALLHFNLALSLNRSGKPAEARKTVENALTLDPNHPGSHYVLGSLYVDGGYRVPAFLAYSRFLVLEPGSERSKKAILQLRAILAGGVTKGDQPNHINITLSTDSKKDEGDFDAVALFMSLSAAADTTEQGKKSTPFQALADNYAVVTSVMKSSIKKPGGFAARYYVPYFVEMHRKGHYPAFVYTAWRQGELGGSVEWGKANEAKVREFQQWSQAWTWSSGK
jgi:tetratricopeptide (TPR) repeat protein